MKNKLSTLVKSAVFSLILLLSINTEAVNNKINLSGTWNFKLDSTDLGLAQKWYSSQLPDKINLPGTTDDAGFGIPNTLKPELEKPQVLHLTRKNSYVGAAWYSKEVNIPKNWASKNIMLKLERVIWESRVWVDGKAIEGKQESLTTAHYFNLSKNLSPGKHTITIRVDNRKKYDISVKDLAHAYTNDTQIMWNGILGEISCTANDNISIAGIQVTPDIDRKLITVKVSIQHPQTASIKGILELSVSTTKGCQQLKKTNTSFKVNKSDSILVLTYPMGNDFSLWNEFNPALYELSANIKGKGFASTHKTTFGMRKLTNQAGHIQVNGQNIFLRGTLECCIFPLTGHPPMDKKEWEKVFGTAREWGLNHLRFHSWCPPKAAFEVADELGFYLQVELPYWSLTVNKDQPTNEFLYAEADKIIKEYGNHPSFCFWSIGNELQPDFNFLNSFVDKLKAKDPRHLYTNTSYTFEKGHGDWPEKNDDFFITQKTKKGWVRGQGVFETESPSFDKNYSASVVNMSVPVITHEIGQYAVYPNINEIEKYTGVLDPLNFKAVKADLTKKGLLNKANDYLMASGKLAALLYKEEIERAMKTNGISGFQLLDLHDFPGQGTALVGLLDAFWDSKGLISSKEFKSFCGPLVPLAYFEKAVFKNNETFTAKLEIANFSDKSIEKSKLKWTVSNQSGSILKSGEIDVAAIPSGKNTIVGTIDCPLNFVDKAEQLAFKVSIDNTEFYNQWKMWVYPSETKIEMGDVLYTQDFNTANTALNEGKKVLYNPDWKKLKGIQGKFLPVFWSPVHFPKQAATMGLLCNPNHPALKNFPTEMHTDWQWWDLLINSRTLILDSIPAVSPIVEMIDNFANNRRLATIFEVKAGKGKLIYSSMDLYEKINERPEAKQLLISILKYMNSANFEPKNQISFSQLSIFETNKITNQSTNPTDIY